MSALTGEARKLKKDVLADIVSTKYECQNYIMDASMRKAILNQSESDVKEDMQIIIQRLQHLLKVIHDNARFETAQEVKADVEKINDEIIFLEEHYKSLEEMEEYVKTNTSNTNLKPLKVGKERCEAARERLDAYKIGITRKCAKFALHPLLAQILEQIETFSLGNTLVLPLPEESNVIAEEDEDNLNEASGLQRQPSRDPLRTSFMRSNSSKLIKLPEKAGSTTSSRQNSRVDLGASKQTGLNSRRNPTSSISSNGTFNADSTVPSQKQSKLITRSKTKIVTIHKDTEDNTESAENEYRTVAGLKATITGRSLSAPFINLTSSKSSAFVQKKEEYKSPLNISLKEVFNTMKHTNGCYITGIAVLSNGNVVVCDAPHDSLQLYNAETKSISEIECPHPWGVAAVSDTAVAVSLHYDQKIILVQAAATLERLNEKEILLKCNAALVYDLQYYAYRIYALCSDSDIHILDLKGREYNKIKTGMPMNTLRYFDLQAEKGEIIVSGEKGVACLNMKGLPLWRFQPENKSRLIFTGVLVYRGCIIVNDWENSNLVEIYNEGEDLKVLFSQNLERPMALCKSLSELEIFVTQADYDLSDEKARTVKVLNVAMAEKE